jgi:hypothetical protein
LRALGTHVPGDSDFAILNCPGYVNVRTLDFNDPDGVLLGTLYSQNKLARSLGLRPDKLPILGCILENDQVEDDDRLRLYSMRFINTHAGQ